MDSEEFGDLEAEYQKLRLGKETRRPWEEKNHRKDDTVEGCVEDKSRIGKKTEKEKKEEDEEEDIEWDEELTVEEAAKLKEEGNQLKKSNKLQESIMKYSRALQCKQVPSETRSLYYLNRAITYSCLNEFEHAIKDSTRALKLNPKYDKARRVRRIAAEKSGKWEVALEDAKALGFPSPELSRLEVKVKEERERRNAEALEQLKDMGNSFLKTFGLSLDNFKMDKDPSTGAYNIRYEQGQ